MDPGFIFAPADHVLTDKYLGGEIAGRPVACPYIDHANVYSALPEDLVSGRRSVRDRDGNDAYFLYTSVRFATKNKTGHKLRRIDDDPRKSYWHSEKGKIPLKDSKMGGYVQDFVHAIKDTHSRVERLGWRMKEYGLSTEHGDSDIVICKLYHTPRKPSTSRASTSTTASASSVEQDAHLCSKKRKAAADPEDSTLPRARPRPLTPEHPPVADPVLTVEPESADDELYKMYGQVMDGDRIKSVMPDAPDPMEDLHGYLNWFQEIDAKKAAQQEPATDAPPSSFCHSMEQEFPSLYPNHNNVEDEEAAPPVQAAQLEEEELAADDQMDARLSEDGAHQETTEPDEPTPNEVIYGLPCPAFSPEMVLRCAMTPWPSPSSMPMIFDLY